MTLIDNDKTAAQLAAELEDARAKIAELTRSVESYQGILTRLGVGIAVHAPDTTILFSNAAASQILGRTAEQLAGKTAMDSAWQFVREDGSALPVDEYPVSRVLASLEPLDALVLGVDRLATGDRVWVQVRAIPEFGPDRELLRVVVTFDDITDHKRAEEAQREGESRFRAFVEQAPVAIGVWNLDGTGAYANRKYLDILGLRSVEQLVGRPASELFAPQFREESRERTRRRLQGLPVPVEFESVAMRADGSEFPVLLSVAPIRLTEGTLSIAFMTDLTERNRADKALRESEERFRRVIDTTGACIYEIDDQGRITFLSDRVTAVLGYAPEELIGKTPFDSLDSAEEVKRARALFVEHVQNRRPFQTMEHRCRTKGGQLRTLRVSGVPLFDAAGSLVGYQGAVEDITEGKQAEEALLAMGDMLDTAPSSILVHDFEGRFLYANRKTFELHGYDEREFMALNLSEIDVPESAALIAERMGAIVEHGEATFPVRHFRKDGSVFPLEVFVKQVVWRGIPAMLSVGTDITERKRAEDALRGTTDRLHLATASAKAGVWDWHLPTNQMIWDDRMLELYGLARETFPGGIAAWEQGLHPEDRSRATEECEAALRGEREFDTEFRVRHPDGTVVHIKANGLVLRDEKGKPVRMIGLNTDITDRKLAEEEKAKLEVQLLQAQKMESVGRLAGGVAHDFNNMLSVILGNVGMAIEQLAPSHPLREDLEEIRIAAERSANLTRQLLAFARKQTVAPKVLDLNETIESMLRMLRRLIGEDIELAWLPAAVLWPVKVDPSQIDQILVNLCVNARDAIGGVGNLTIETANCTFDDAYCAAHAEAVPGAYVKLVVSDDGCGMGKDTLAHLFEPFFTTKGLREGTGLGLATVYGIAKQNNGFVNVYSEPDKGTTFTVYLPRHVAARRVQAQSAPPTGLSERGRETILVVEDEPAILKLTKRMLERLGYTVLTASTPGEAIRVASEHIGEIHLLITDVVMPEMNGRELARNLLTSYPALKRLFMSGYTANVIAHHGVLDEGVHFIEKPFSKQDLAARVSEALERGG